MSCFIWSAALDLQLWCSSIILYHITSIAYNHHTDIHPLLSSKHPTTGASRGSEVRPGSHNYIYSIDTAEAEGEAEGDGNGSSNSNIGAGETLGLGPGLGLEVGSGGIGSANTNIGVNIGTNIGVAGLEHQTWGFEQGSGSGSGSAPSSPGGATGINRDGIAFRAPSSPGGANGINGDGINGDGIAFRVHGDRDGDIDRDIDRDRGISTHTGSSGSGSASGGGTGSRYVVTARLSVEYVLFSSYHLIIT